MARHAGFAAVASINEETANKVLATYFVQVQGPYFVPLPQTVPVGADVVTFAGIIQMDTPTIELHTDPNDLVTTHFTFRTIMKAQVNNNAMRQWTIQFNVTAQTRLIAQVVNSRVVLGVNMSQTTISPLQVTVLVGPPLPPPISNALQSPTLANILTTAVRPVPNQTISPPMLQTRFTRTVPGNFKETQFSVFDWFTIDVSVSNIAVKTLEHAISVGIDLAGFTAGNRNQLIDLTRLPGGGAIYVRTIFPGTDPLGVPILVRRGYGSLTPIALALNVGAISQIVATQVNPRVADTPISSKAVLKSVSVGYSKFTKPLRGAEDGLDLHFTAEAMGFGFTGDAYIQIYLQTYDGPTNFLQPEGWKFYIGYVDIDLPLGLELLVLLFQALLCVAAPMALILTSFNLSLQGVVLDELQNWFTALGEANEGHVAEVTQGSLAGAGNDIQVPATSWSSPLPNTNAPRWDGMIRYISVGPEVIDVGVGTWINWADAANLPQPQGTITPTTWSAMDRSAIPLSLLLRPDLLRMAGNGLQLNWLVTRDDTGAIIANVTRAYAPGVNGPTIDHHSKDLYVVKSFTVRCTASLTVGSQVGDVWTGTQTLTIEDNLDRSHSFVEWGPRWVYWKGPASTPDAIDWWSHFRRSRIHRTATAARCKMLQRKAFIDDYKKRKSLDNKAPFQYRDLLPFPFEEVVHHRKVLCEYCFFGGPEKEISLPQEDWFKPLSDVIVHKLTAGGGP